MGYEFLFLLGLAIALGFKHAYDPDHVVAVSNVIARSNGLKKTSLLSVSWALGHMVTAATVAILLFAFREVFLTELLAVLEILVVVMLVVIGVLALLWEFNILHVHEHWHGLFKHRHLHTHAGKHGGHGTMFSIGVVHGVASNDELLLLLVVALGVTSLGGLLVSVTAFTVGVVVGMILFGVAVSYPLLRWRKEKIRRTVTVVAAVLSLTYAALLLLGWGLPNPIPVPF
ncbi:MAG: sulfite exporter TauE/SafE family protein [Thermoplasmata archaeon]